MKPMLAATVKDVAEIAYPVYASEKLDGIRCLVVNGVAVSRNLKPIPNRWVQAVIGKHSLSGLDGELIVGSPTSSDCFRNTTKGVMSKEGFPDFKYHVFDVFAGLIVPDGVPTQYNSPFHKRLGEVTDILNHQNLIPCTTYQDRRVYSLDFIISVVQYEVSSEDVLASLERTVLEQGYEGLIVRSQGGPYKYGRSTLRQGFLLKVKQFADGEAKILGFMELEANRNILEVDELGYAKRTAHKANMEGQGTLGSLLVKDIHSQVTFGIGSGFSAEERQAIWDEQDALMGKVVKYKHFPIGVKDKPRFPTFLGFRSKGDM